jgi:hypothetical protein
MHSRQIVKSEVQREIFGHSRRDVNEELQRACNEIFHN